MDFREKSARATAWAELDSPLVLMSDVGLHHGLPPRAEHRPGSRCRSHVGAVSKHRTASSPDGAGPRPILHEEA